jgi:DNA primase
MALIPEEIISRVIDRCDIVDAVSSYIPLKRVGRNFKACCPFHNEKTPSFIVNPDKQIFHCFGCGAGGNVVSFIMKQEHMEFPEAVRFLAQRVNVVIPSSDTSVPHMANIRQAILRVNALAVQFFHKFLISDQSVATQKALDYLHRRKVEQGTIRKFQLGLAPDRWDALLTYLKSEGIPLSLMEKAGLIIPREGGRGYYDRFRNRVMFPIFDTRAHCRAFGARALDEAIADGQGAKYINSPETIIYTKGHHLYGFHLSRQAIAEEDSVIIVEGYLDCLIPYQAGIYNVVASLGTALTVDQIRLLRRYTPNVVMLFDMDPAGEAAMMRSLDILLEEGMSVKVATLEDGEDPDSFVRRYGAKAFRERIAGAQKLFDYKLTVLLKRFDKQAAEGKAKIAGEMLPTVYRCKNDLIKADYLKSLAHVLDISEHILIQEYNKVGQTLSQRISVRLREQAAGNQARARVVERSLLKLILEKENVIPKARAEVTLLDFQDAQIRFVLAKIFALFEQGRKTDTRSLISSFENPDIQQMLSGIVAEEEIRGNWEKVYEDCIIRIKHDRLKWQRQRILQQIQEAEVAGDARSVDELTRQFNQCIRK